MKYSFSILFVFIISTALSAQNIIVNKIEPPNWWTGMKNNNIQLMIYGDNLKDVTAKFKDKSIIVKRVNKLANPSYAFIDIEIPPNTKPDNYELILTRGKEKASVKFPILKREVNTRLFQGFTSKDVIYLLMPDRFANGDPSNDSIPGYSDYMSKTPNQNRAGGDIQGMINKLDYLKDLGITAIWPTPLTENNTYRSYHGYATTDFYKIDPRFGTNELYKIFVDEAHKRNLKIILDHVSNHFSDDHVWMKNPPTPDWTNGTKEDHLDANHNKMIFTDPYADSSTIKHVEQGWFINSMPDINQTNPFVANYIIQNTIWWMEYAGLDAIREDTYPYNNQKFMARWSKTVMEEYPTTNIVGEVWSGIPAFLAGYQKDTFLPRSFNSNLPAITDFGLRDVLIKYLSSENSLYNVFEVLAEDYLYKNPNNLVTFVDNHDLPRVIYFAKGNIDKAKNLYTILLTTRGIPQIFYGSEIGMVGTDDHGKLRAPFPGGFPNDTRNAFTQEGRTKEENDIFTFLHDLIQLRKTYPALSIGKLIHFPPVNDIYLYFRTLEKEIIMVVVNNNRSASMNFVLGGIYSDGPVPFQMMYSLPGNIQNLGQSFTFRTLGIGEVFGDRVLTLSINNNFNDEIFRLLNLTFLIDWQVNLSAYFNAALLEISPKSRSIITQPFVEFQKPFYEIGFGIGQALFPFRLEFTWKLNYFGNNNFVVGINSGLF